jgi:hypothetical protein
VTTADICFAVIGSRALDTGEAAAAAQVSGWAQERVTQEVQRLLNSLQV